MGSGSKFSFNQTFKIFFLLVCHNDDMCFLRYCCYRGRFEFRVLAYLYWIRKGSDEQ